MRAYGLPRDKDCEEPDVADIHKFGRKSCVGGKDYWKGKRKAKATSRRYWKRKARKDNKTILRKEYTNV